MTNETEPRQRECQKLIVCMISFSPIIIMAISFAVWRPILVPFPLKVVKMLALHISDDNQRLLDNELLLLETEWKLYEIEKQFGQQRCNKNEDRSIVFLEARYFRVAVTLGWLTRVLHMGTAKHIFAKRCERNTL